MKGSLHTDELMHEVMRRENRLRTERRISHAYVMLLPTSGKPLILSDCAINIAPELGDKVDIVQNAIDLAIALGIVDAQGGGACRRRNRDGTHAVDDRRRRALQDGRSRPDPGRGARRTACVR